jgi:DNA-binding NarL/FixJ family response regulator
MTRVVVVDDHPVFREGLVTVLTDRGLDVVAEADSGEQALEAVALHAPDVVLMDLAMPGLGGVEATRRIAAEHPATAVLVVTMNDDDDTVFAASRQGHAATWSRSRRQPTSPGPSRSSRAARQCSGRASRGRCSRPRWAAPAFRRSHSRS